jgi:hypothetical protein
VQNLAYSRKGFTVLLMLNTLEMAHNSFSPRYGQYRNPDRSLESEIYLADSDGNNFKMILEKREAI